jgi:nitrogen regulatory protein PII 2
MKEIIAIIRPRKTGVTRDVLEKLGFPSMTATQVLGRGKQRGIVNEVSCEISPDVLSQNQTKRMEFIPKREISIIVKNSDVGLVVQTIIKLNQTGQIGDGKIFVCPVENALRVRTGETGDDAIV